MDDRQRKASFAELLRPCQARLLGYLHALVRDLDDAEDLFQQTTVILWKKFDEFDGSRSFLAWACGVGRLEAMNFLRARGRHKLYFSDELNLLLVEAQEAFPEDEHEERRAALTGCVEKLRESDRELLRECYAPGASPTKVAERLGRIPQSIQNSLRRIRRALFECIQRALAQQTHPEPE
jgi:RNA polymerase sigma-70 factor (ECF subfamily)